MKIENEIKQTKFNSNRHKAVVNIMFTNNWVIQSQMKLLKQFKFTQPQYNVLRILRGSSPEIMSINTILSRMLDKMSNVSRLVDKLVEKGYVDRTQSSEDRRSVNVVITKKGLNILSEIDIKQSDWETNFSDISEENASKLSDLVDILRK